MKQRYMIGGLARAADVPTSTALYYDRRGLLKPTGRSESNYRVYGEAGLDLLRFIRAAQSTGFQVRDIELPIELPIELRSGGGNPCGEVRSVIEAELRGIHGKFGLLRSARCGADRACRLWFIRAATWPGATVHKLRRLESAAG